MAPAIAGDGTQDSMIILLITQAAIASVLVIAVAAIFREKPPSPPSIGAYILEKTRRANKAAKDRSDATNAQVDDAVSGQVGYYYQQVSNQATTAADGMDENNLHSGASSHGMKDEMLKLVKNRDFVILVIAFGLGFGVLQSFVSIINQVIIPMDYSDNDGAIFGMLIIGCGLIGALLFGAISGITKFYRLVLWSCGIASLGSFVWFCVLMMWPKTQSLFIMSCVSCALIGMFATAIVPVALELGEEVTFPCAAEGLANGIMYLTGTAICAICLVIESFIPLRPYPNPSKTPKPGNMQYSLWFCLALLSVAIGLMFLLRGKYRRYEHESARSNNSETMSNHAQIQQ